MKVLCNMIVRSVVFLTGHVQVYRRHGARDMYRCERSRPPREWGGESTMRVMLQGHWGSSIMARRLILVGRTEGFASGRRCDILFAFFLVPGIGEMMSCRRRWQTTRRLVESGYLTRLRARLCCSSCSSLAASQPCTVQLDFRN